MSGPVMNDIKDAHGSDLCADLGMDFSARGLDGHEGVLLSMLTPAESYNTHALFSSKSRKI